MEITELLHKAVSDVKSALDSDCIIGTPVVNEYDLTVVPVSRMTIGFAGIGGELDAKSKKDKELPVGGLGGGANIQPLGFLVISGEKVRFVNIEGGDNRWEKYAETVLDFLSK